MLTMICGLPNAGKTTYSKCFENALHQDDLGFITNIINLIKQIKEDVVIEGVFSTAEERKKVISAWSGIKKCIFIDISVEECIRREKRNRHPIVLRHVAKLFEPPTYAEGWDEIIIIRNNQPSQLSAD